MRTFWIDYEQQVQWAANEEANELLRRDHAAEEARKFHERFQHEKHSHRLQVGPVEKRYLLALIAYGERNRRRRNRVWAADGTGIPVILRGHTDALNSAQWSPNGERIVTASDDKTARIWSAADARELFQLKHEVEVSAAVCVLESGE